MSLAQIEGRYVAECEKRGLPILPIREMEYALLLSQLGEKTGLPEVLSDWDRTELLDWVRRSLEVYERVEGEERRIQLLCIEALKHGYRLHEVDDGEEIYDAAGVSIAEVIERATAVDESLIRFKGRTSGKLISFLLVFGNSPEEVIADHSQHPDAELIWEAVNRRA